MQRYKLSAYLTEANLWAPGGGALILQSARPVQFAAGAFDDIVCANNPSVSRSADTSPYTGEALGWCDAEGGMNLSIPLFMGLAHCKGVVYNITVKFNGRGGLSCCPHRKDDQPWLEKI